MYFARRAPESGQKPLIVDSFELGFAEGNQHLPHLNLRTDVFLMVVTHHSGPILYQHREQVNMVVTAQQVYTTPA